MSSNQSNRLQDDQLQADPGSNTVVIPFAPKRTITWNRTFSNVTILGAGLLATLAFTQVKHAFDHETLFFGLIVSGFVFNLMHLIKINGSKEAVISEKMHLEAMAANRTEILASKHETTETIIHLLNARNSQLEREVAKHINEAESRSDELRSSQEVTIMALASLAETRDNETGNHIFRTQHYIRVLAVKLQTQERFCVELNTAFIEQLFKAAPLHDIGKVGIPDRILLKPDRLDPDETKIMETHTTLGRDAIKTAQRRVGVNVPQLDVAMEIALSHHEKWDGTGYPEGLAGESIPISARLMAVADVYDALISNRVYKKAMTHEQAVAIILKNKFSHFDPAIVDAFIEVQTEFKEIAQRYADTPLDMQKKIAHMENSIAEVVDVQQQFGNLAA